MTTAVPAPFHAPHVMSIDLETAIRHRRLVEFVYLSQPRVVQPAVLGPWRANGDLTLRAYQVGGRSNSRTPPFWTLFTVARIVDLRLSDRVFPEDPPGYRNGESHVFPVVAEL